MESSERSVFDLTRQLVKEGGQLADRLSIEVDKLRRNGDKEMIAAAQTVLSAYMQYLQILQQYLEFAERRAS